MKNDKLIYILLGCFGGFGPFVTDLYLSCLPEISKYYEATVSMAQLSLTSCMLGLAIGQLFIGPLTDKYGRKRPLNLCLLLFILSSIGCIFSPNITIFVIFRLMQGLAGAGGLVISKVFVTDMYSGEEMARKFAILNAVQSITPIIAPVLGSFIFSLSSWQGIFIFLALWGVLMILASPVIKESLPREKRLAVPIWETFIAFGPVLRNKQFVIFTIMQGLVFATMFTYISASPFLFQEHFSLSPIAYGIWFAVNAFGLIGGNALVIRFNNKAGLRIGILSLVFSSIAIAGSLMADFTFVVIEVFMFIMLVCVGFLMTATTTYALAAVEMNKGAATALLGTVVFMFAAIVTPLSGIGDMVYTFSIMLVVFSILTLGLFPPTYKRI